MVASEILNSKFGRCRGQVLNLNFGNKEVMVASKIQSSSLGIKEVQTVKNLDFADWPFPESAAAQLKKSKIWFRGLGIIITASSKYKNVEYEKLTVYIYIYIYI